MAKATIKMIAERAGVSRGTVDRVLNNRPYVKKDIAERVLQVIQELNYTPNAAAKALKSKKNVRIAVIMPPRKNKLFEGMAYGILNAQHEYEAFGVSVELLEMKEDSIEEQVRLLEKVEGGGYDGVAVAPLDAISVKRAVKRIIASGIPLSTFLSDIRGVDRLCFVGPDNRACGRVAAQLMDTCVGEGSVLIAIGKRNISANVMRAEHFKKHMAKLNPGIVVEEDFETFESDEMAYKLCWDMFGRYPNTAGIFVIGEGLDGICKFLGETGRAGAVKVVCTDFIGNTAKLMKEGLVKFAIGQQPFVQGYYPAKILAEHLINGVKLKKHHIYTHINIETSETIDYLSMFENDLLALSIK